MDRDEPSKAVEQRLKVLFGMRRGGVIPEVTGDALLVYQDFLKKHLTFPMKGSFTEGSGPLQSTPYDVLISSLFSDVDEWYGVIGCGMSRGKHVEIPLAEFDLDDETDRNYQVLDDYKTWFWNYR